MFQFIKDAFLKSIQYLPYLYSVFVLNSPEALVTCLRAESILSLASHMVASLVDHGGAPELALVVALLGARGEGLALPGEREHAGLS